MHDVSRDVVRLETMLTVIASLDRRLSDVTYDRFTEDDDERDLAAFRLSVIGENAHKLSDALKARHPGIPWREMYAFRNLVSHDYMMIVPRFVWAAAQELDAIRAMCTAELARLDASPPKP